MADFGFYPELQLQQPDLLGQYLRGLSAPTQLAQQQQNLQAGSLQMQQLRLALQKQGMLLDLANQRSTTGEGGSADQGSASPSVGRTGGIQNGPQDAVAGPAPPPYLAANSPAAFTPAPAPQNQIGNDYSPQQLRTLSLLAPETLKSIGEARDIQIKQAQFRAQPMLNTLDTVFDSDRPAEIAMRNPDLISRWPQLARQMNLDPVSDFNDQNVRRAIALAANNIRGGVGLTAKDYPVQAQNLYGANGQFLQRNPITGEEKEVVGQKLPTFSMQPLGYDPTTGQDKSQLMITSPGGSPAPGAPSGGPGGGGGLGSMVGPQIAAYKAPS